jgi:hypothetical protein
MRATQKEKLEASLGIGPYVLFRRWTTQGAVPCRSCSRKARQMSINSALVGGNCGGEATTVDEEVDGWGGEEREREREDGVTADAIRFRIGFDSVVEGTVRLGEGGWTGGSVVIPSSRSSS